MRTLRIFYFCLLLLTAQNAFAQSVNEFNTYLKTGVLFAKGDLDQRNSRYYVSVNNTLQQTIGGNYTRVTKQGILLSAGLDFGYERYKASLNVPLGEAATHPAELFDASVAFADVNLNIGYRFKVGKVFSPEIRIGESFHYYLSSKQYRSIGPTAYFSRGFFGNIDPAVHGRTLVTQLYLGTGIRAKGRIKRYNVGLQLQRKFDSNPQNYFEVAYSGVNTIGSTYEEVFSGTATTINLVLGMTF